jgi:hypothetical protein
MNKRVERILNEVAILAVAYGAVEFDEKAFSWVYIPRFPLPKGWNKRSTELLIELPPTYPWTPPTAFHMDKGLRRYGRSVAHYFEERDMSRYSRKGWAYFCLHVKECGRGGWNPTDSVIKGDNLLKYTELIRTVLTKPPRF